MDISASFPLYYVKIPLTGKKYRIKDVLYVKPLTEEDKENIKKGFGTTIPPLLEDYNPIEFGIHKDFTRITLLLMLLSPIVVFIIYRKIK
jgi:hypothetical protein